ncbi:MAG: acyltransferase family protein [Patescibacteria group bacterium]|nr:MAG: acyltransferase family protein [Patescibacteria group bacterium]
MQDSAAPARPTYRPDIDGLRGLAVLGVVAFHAFPGLLPAGFIGVDVFFVISGFLITTIILNGLASGRFRFREFYGRRIRRIFPALIAVLAAAYLVAWFTFDAVELRKLGLHVLGGATFSSNFLLWNEIGYFDVAADRKALLHLWSLAIEEQFYLLFPVVLWIAHRRRAHPMFPIAVFGGLSFVANIFSMNEAAAGFYSPATRAWELMIGAAAAAVSREHRGRWSDAWEASERWLEKGGRRIPGWPKENALGNIVAFLGAYLLLLGFTLIVKEEAFPGWWALLPTLGAVFTIVGGASAWFNRRVLSLRPLVWCGLISFPLYLWHWPLLSYARILTGGTPAWPWRLLLVAAAFVLAGLTYAYVERPMRFGLASKTAVKYLLAWLSLLGLIGFLTYWDGGFGFRPVARRLGDYVRTISIATAESAAVKVGDPDWFWKIGQQAAPPAAFIMGDSHAGAFLPAFAKYGHEHDTSFLYVLTKACLTEEPCRTENEQVFRYIRDHEIGDVIIAFRWSNYDHLLAEGRSTQMRAWLDRTVALYRSIGVRVHLVVDNPVQEKHPRDTLRRRLNTDQAINTHGLTREEYAAQQDGYASQLAAYAGNGVEVLDFTDLYCGQEICPLVKDGKFLYGDQNHLSPDGALLVYPVLERALKRM